MSEQYSDMDDKDNEPEQQYSDNGDEDEPEVGQRQQQVE